jgi:YHS domain-containing protein
MPYFSNFNCRLGGKSLTARSVRTIARLAAALLAITVASRASADEVTRWNQIATDASTAADTNPLRESCVFAILHLAIHDAVNVVQARYEPYLPRTSPAPGASVEAAIAGAAHDTLVAVLPASKVRKPEIKSSYQSATYLFASAEDKADFDRDPAKYAPHYGGFCAYGVANEVLADIEGPEGFVYKGKLYASGDKNAGESFRTDLDSNIEKADTNWRQLSGS